MRNRLVTAILMTAALSLGACSGTAAPTAQPTITPSAAATAGASATAAPSPPPSTAPSSAPATATSTSPSTTPSSAPSSVPAGSPAASPSAAASSTAPSPTASATSSATSSASASMSAACTAASLATRTPGKLVIGADNPAFPPYFQTDPADPKWDLGNPNNGKGLESATAYAVAEKLGFAKADVTWIPVVFNNAIQPGKKDFDLYLTQVSYSAERAQAVDLSDGYFDLNQSVVGLKGAPIASVTTMAGLKDFRLGTQVGTTSYSYITDQIQPTAAPMAYDSMDAAISALKAKQIDGIVADLSTAFYMVGAQLDNGVIVGSLPTVGEVEHFSILLSKGSPLTACVNEALAALKADGTLAAISQQWIANEGVPELK